MLAYSQKDLDFICLFVCFGGVGVGGEKINPFPIYPVGYDISILCKQEQVHIQVHI